MDKALRLRRVLTTLLTTVTLALCAAAQAQSPPADRDLPMPGATASTDVPSSEPQSGNPSVLGDVGAYFTAPLHWERSDWGWFAGSLLAIGIAHRYDTQVRTHFVGSGPVTTTDTHDSQDAIPSAVVFGGTWLFALLTQDRDGYREGWAMAEAAALSVGAGYGLKYAFGRQGPDQTTDPNAWFKNGNSFPSVHATASFAIGTVLAESGNDDYRLLRRLLGYGLGVATSYERLRHNAHWLSDTVAGAALGISSGHFAMNRRYASGGESHLALVPIEGGAMLTYRVTLQ